MHDNYLSMIKVWQTHVRRCKSAFGKETVFLIDGRKKSKILVLRKGLFTGCSRNHLKCCLLPFLAHLIHGIRCTIAVKSWKFTISASLYSSPGNLIGLEWKEAKRGVERGRNRPLLPLSLSPEVMWLIIDLLIGLERSHDFWWEAKGQKRPILWQEADSASLGLFPLLSWQSDWHRVERGRIYQISNFL